MGSVKKKRLRGEKLIAAVKAELGRMANLSPNEVRINIATVAARVGISRQTLYSNNLKGLVSEFAELQSNNFSNALEAASCRHSLMERIAVLEEENSDLRRNLDSYLEKWLSVEYNCRMLGVDADQLFNAQQKPSREIMRPKSRYRF